MSINVEPGLYIGLQETFSKVITEGESALFAGLVGDNRPQISAIRGDVTSKTPKLPANYSLMTGIIVGLLNSRILGEKSQCVSTTFEYLAPIYCGDRIDTIIELTAHDAGKHLATFRTNCYDQENNQMITGQVVMLVHA